MGWGVWCPMFSGKRRLGHLEGKWLHRGLLSKHVSEVQAERTALHILTLPINCAMMFRVTLGALGSNTSAVGETCISTFPALSILLSGEPHKGIPEGCANRLFPWNETGVSEVRTQRVIHLHYWLQRLRRCGP